jgi:iron complex transport system ATP-binding protein
MSTTLREEPEGPGVAWHAGRVTSEPDHLRRAPALLAVRGVSVWTPEQTVLLDGINWSVGPGEHWALLGPNGAGKSTLLRIAGGLSHPSTGTVDILGRRLGRVDVRTLWPLIGFVNPSLRPPPPGLPVEDVVLTGATGTIQPLWERYGPDERRRVDRLLEVMGVDRLVGREFGTCSDGERGRVLIARALMPAPRLLLLDEPTAGLDMAGREDLLAALSQLAGEEPDLASVVVSHHLEDLPVTTQHAALLKGGRMLSCGGVDDVLTDDIVSRCFGVAVRVHRTDGRWAAVHPAEVVSR